MKFETTITIPIVNSIPSRGDVDKRINDACKQRPGDTVTYHPDKDVDCKEIGGAMQVSVIDSVLAVRVMTELNR